jgi:protein involved in polysaccharide export with SLBB domain
VPVQTSGPQNVRIDLATLTSEDPRKLDLPDGAVVMVERCDPPALQVIGLVKEPQQIEFPVGKDVHLLDAIAMAKGQNSLVADKIYIIRRRPEEPEPALIQVSMRAAKRNGAENLLLEPGDTISVEQTPSTVLLEVVKAVGFNINAYARAP